MGNGLAWVDLRGPPVSRRGPSPNVQVAIVAGRSTDSRARPGGSLTDGPARWTWVVAAIAVVMYGLTLGITPAWTWEWDLLPFAVAVIVVGWFIVSVRVPHSREWSRAGTLAFAFGAFLAFGPVQAAIVALIYPVARFVVDRPRHVGSPVIAYVFLAGRTVLGVLAGGWLASRVIDSPYWSPGDSDLGGLMPFAVGYLVIQLLALAGLRASGNPDWDGYRVGRLSSLGVPQLAQFAVWEAAAVIGATISALIIDTVGLRLDYWVSCALALIIIVGLNVTLDRNALLRERNAELGRALAELRALNEFSRAIAANHEANSLVDEIGEQIRRVSGADAVEIARLDPIRGRLRYVFSAHAGVRQPERFERVPPVPVGGDGPDDSSGEAGIVIRSVWAGRTVQGAEVESHALVRPDGTILPLDRSGVRHFHSAVAVPLTAGGEQIGVIAVKAHRPGQFTPARVGLLERIAGQAGLAIRNAEVLAAERASDLARQDFLSVVSHELRTPITTISGYAQLLSRRMAKRIRAMEDAVDPAAETEGRMIDVIVGQSRQLGRLVDDLVLLSGLGRGETRLDLAAVDLVELAREAVTAIRFSSSDPERLVLDAEAPVVVEGDRTRLRQVLDNLLERTSSHAATGQPVTVTVRDLGGTAELRVIDLGNALTDSQRTRVFEPFQRAEGDSTQGSAELGVAMSIVREIVISHGGNVSAERADGHGTTFIVRLPKGGPGPKRGSGEGGTGDRLATIDPGSGKPGAEHG